VPEFKPHFQQQDAHQVPAVDESEHRHRRRQVRGQQDLVEAFGMTQVHQQRQRRHDHEAERREQRQPVGRPHFFHAEDFFERGQDERAGDEARDVRIHHDQDRPVDLDFVGIDEAGDPAKQLGQMRSRFGAHRTSPSSCA
jgi:hypothetical protein